MLALLAIVCPPLAVLATDSRSRAAANLGLTLMGYFPGMFHAWGTVEKHSIERRYEMVMRALETRRI
jgi:uncharacterized membrane protein YqaE (UPF0057 family)